MRKTNDDKDADFQKIKNRGQKNEDYSLFYLYFWQIRKN